MKRLTATVCAILLGLISTAFAGPEDLLLKLAQGAAKTEGSQVLEVVLTQAETKELVDFVLDLYKREGKDITREQAAVATGQMAGMASAALQMQKAFGKGTGKPATPPAPAAPQTEPLNTTPAGYLFFSPQTLQQQFNNNEFAIIEKTKTKPVAITGSVKSLRKGKFFPGGNMEGSRDSIAIRMDDGFTGHITDASPKFDPAAIVVGDRVVLFCTEPHRGMGTIQAECRMVGHGTQSGPIFQDDALLKLLNTPEQP